MGGFVSFLIGLVVGWLACKLLTGSKPTNEVPALPANTNTSAETPTASPVVPPTAPVAPSPAAPSAVVPAPAASVNESSEDHAGLAAQLHLAKAEIESRATEVRRLETEIDAARRNLLAARHTASNHGSTIASLRDEVKRLQRDLKAALEAATK